MIKFDSTHKSFNASIEKKLGKRVKNIIVSGLIISSVFSLTGCSNICNIKETHVHKYVSNDDELVVYAGHDIHGYRFYDGILFNQTDECLLVSEEEKELCRFAARNGLIKIKDNENVIDSKLDINIDSFYEYEYKYSRTTMAGSTPCTTTVYSWTKDPEHPNLTGKIRVAYPVYYGYNIVKNEDNEYELIKSNPYMSYDELVNNGYQYIKFSIQEFIAFNVNELDKNMEPESKIIK